MECVIVKNSCTIRKTTANTTNSLLNEITCTNIKCVVALMDIECDNSK